MRVGNLVARHDVRPVRAEGVHGLRLVPLLRADELQVARRHVVDHGVAEDVIERVLLRDVARRLADNDRHLHFVVHLLRHRGRPRQVVVGAAYGARELAEQHRLGRHRQIGLLAVVYVVQADGDDLGRLPDRRQHPDLRQRVRLRSRIVQRLARPVQHRVAAPRDLQQSAVGSRRQARRREIDHPVALQHAGTGPAFNGKCKQLHCSSSGTVNGKG